MLLCFSVMCMVTRGNTARRCMSNANTRNSCAATRKARAANLSTQLIVGWLSLKSATWEICREANGQTSSMTRKRSTSPAHSRSELVMVLAWNSAFTSLGHSSRNTMGTHSRSSPKITPPTPWPGAFFTPANDGHHGTSSRHDVDAFSESRKKERQSRTATSSPRLWCRWTRGGFNASTRLQTDSKPRPAGIAVNT